MISIAVLGISMLVLWETYLSFGGLIDHAIWAFGVVIFLHAPTMLLNFMVLNEQHYWYWASIAWLLYKGHKRYNL